MKRKLYQIVQEDIFNDNYEIDKNSRRQRYSTNVFFGVHVHVDDKLIAADSEYDFKEFVNNLGREFKITIKLTSFMLNLENNGKETNALCGKEFRMF